MSGDGESMLATPMVTLYSTPDCHLCDEAAAILATLERRARFRWRRVDIRSNASLFERYRYDIPVIQIDGGATLTWPTTRERVFRALRDVRFSR
jgi:hypothetical protein